jgi:ribosomal protein L11 methyltransferase
MTWCAVRVQAPESDKDAMAAWLVGHTGHAVQEQDDGSLVSFAESESAGHALVNSLQDVFGSDATGEVRPLPRIDWTDHWRDGLRARKVGRLTIAPSWESLPDPLMPGSPDLIILDPETAFGSGEHGSTRSALVLLDRLVRPGTGVLDLGSGSGILTIAAAKLGARRATGIEIDAEALPVAEKNAARNGVTDRVAFIQGDARALAPLLGPVELIVSNILRTANVTLLPAIAASLAPGGYAVFAGMEAPERELFLEALTGAGYAADDETTDEGWWAVAARAH